MFLQAVSTIVKKKGGRDNRRVKTVVVRGVTQVDGHEVSEYVNEMEVTCIYIYIYIYIQGVSRL